MRQIFSCLNTLPKKQVVELNQHFVRNAENLTTCLLK
jgi:hypothetical protein